MIKKMDEGKKALSRRGFIKDASIIVGGISIASLNMGAQSPPKPPKKWDYEADVVVVGYGGAGGAAAIEAADAGASVILLEKLPFPGGSSIMSAGAFAAPGTPMQKGLGIDDSPQKMYDYCMLAGMGVTDPELTKVICENALDTWQWLTDLGGGDISKLWMMVGFSGSPYATPETVIPRWHIPPMTPVLGGAWEHLAVQQAVTARRSITVKLDASASDLFCSDTGKVIGVKAVISGIEKSIRAKKAVVLTTGDFARNDEMSMAFSLNNYIAVKRTATGGTGDGIKMATQLGAALRCMEGAMNNGLVPTKVKANGKATAGMLFEEMPYTNPHILINIHGLRYVKEHPEVKGTLYPVPYWTYYYLGYETFLQDDHKAYAVFDEKLARQGGEKVCPIFSHNLADEVAAGWVIQADSIDGLAQKLNVPMTALSNTVRIYNEDVGKGVDRLYGRTGNLVTIDTSPFYAVEMTFNTIQSHGGVQTNGRAQVVNTKGGIIPCLYAAGSTVGGFLGPFYQHSGLGICQAYTMGRIAGRNAAAEARQ